MNNTGQIVRSKKTGKSNYTAINNYILQNWEMSPEEKTILLYLLSLPEDWVVIKSWLIENCNIGRDRFNKAWKGLQEKGYIVSVRMIEQKTGQIKGWNHIVYEKPVLDETQDTENPKVGESESREIRKSENQSIYKEINEQSNNTTKEILDSKPKKNKFTPPTLEEVTSYLKEKSYNIDAEKFLSYYEATDWYRNGTKIKNWKACVVTWVKNEKQSTPLRQNFNILTLDD